jgi:hypothetical protein
MKEGKSKHKVVLVLNEGSCHKNVSERSSTSLNPDIGHGREVSFTLRPLYHKNV